MTEYNTSPQLQFKRKAQQRYIPTVGTKQYATIGQDAWINATSLDIATYAIKPQITYLCMTQKVVQFKARQFFREEENKKFDKFEVLLISMSSEMLNIQKYLDLF